MLQCYGKDDKRGQLVAIRGAGALLWSSLSEIARRKEVRPVVRVFTNLHVFLYRRSGGKAQAPGYPTLLLTTLGRKTGKPRTIPLVYAAEGDRFIVAAACSGSDQNPARWLNLQHNKDAVVQVMRKKVKVRAELTRPHGRGALR